MWTITSPPSRLPGSASPHDPTRAAEPRAKRPPSRPHRNTVPGGTTLLPPSRPPKSSPPAAGDVKPCLLLEDGRPASLAARSPTSRAVTVEVTAHGVKRSRPTRPGPARRAGEAASGRSPTHRRAPGRPDNAKQKERPAVCENQSKRRNGWGRDVAMHAATGLKNSDGEGTRSDVVPHCKVDLYKRTVARNSYATATCWCLRRENLHGQPETGYLWPPTMSGRPPPSPAGARGAK